MLLCILIYFLVFILSVSLVFCILDRSIRSKGYQGPVSDHFNGTVFINIKTAGTVRVRSGFWSILHWMLTRKKNVWVKRSVHQTKPLPRVEGETLTATLLNHASVLIQTEGLNILTDPIYSKRASPFSFIGPSRFTEPGVAFDDLPPIDVVIISHNHYDHLDLATLRRLVKRDNPRIFVPLGNRNYLESHGIKTSTELDWWESEELAPGVSLVCVAGQHFSARALSDRNKTLWCGYAVQTPHGDIYFAGDTGYGPFVNEIRTRFPQGFRLGLLPIGAFRPEWFMKEVHISPDEAFNIQQELHIQDVVGIHHGTFKLADDTQDEPVTRVKELVGSLPSSQRFLTLLNGENADIRTRA